MPAVGWTLILHDVKTFVGAFEHYVRTALINLLANTATLANRVEVFLSQSNRLELFEEHQRLGFPTRNYPKVSLSLCNYCSKDVYLVRSVVDLRVWERIAVLVCLLFSELYFHITIRILLHSDTIAYSATY
jgi:hypothetical protein